MRIGVAGRPDDWLVAAERGYDYFEENLAPIAAMTDEEFRAVRGLPRRTGLKSEAFNCFFDGGVKLYAEPDAWFRDYCERAPERAAIPGGRISLECFVRKSVRDDIDEAFSPMDAFRRV